MRSVLALVLTVLIPLSLVTTVAVAGTADVVGVEVFKLKKAGDTVFRFKVTVRHGDEGWDHYADAWEVVGPNGTVLGRRVLLHPHVNEQPFTRSADITVPRSVTEVVVRARDKPHGLGGAEMSVQVPHGQ